MRWAAIHLRREGRRQGQAGEILASGEAGNSWNISYSYEYIGEIMRRSIQGVISCLTLALCWGGGAYAAADPLAPTGHWTAVTAGQAATPPMGWNSWNAFHT